MRSTLAGWLAEHQPLAPRAITDAEAGVDDGAVADGGAAPAGAGTDDPCRGRNGRELAPCAESWAWTEASRFLRAWGPWLVALTLGMWLVALSLVRILTRLLGRPLTRWSRSRWLALTASGGQAGGT